MFKVRTFPKKNLQWWYQNRNVIDLDPDFQRTSRVWKNPDQQFLIDSILNGYDIPKIYIADYTTHNIPALNRRSKNYAIIDGKQRLTAIFQFLGNRLPLRKSIFLESHPATRIGNLRFQDLKQRHKSLARRVERFVLDAKVIETDERKKINDVFLRLNKASKALNGAEVRNAMIGKAVEAIRDLGAHKFFDRRIRFSTDRSQEKNAAAKILVLEYESGPAELKKKNLDRFVYTVGEQGGGRFNSTLSRARTNMNIMHGVFRNHDPLLSAQGHLPLYYMFITRLQASDRKKVRDFLAYFESARLRNRRRPPASMEQLLNSYDLASRSINDKISFEERLRILRTKFAAWKRAH